MAYVHDGGGIKLIPEARVLHVLALCGHVFLHSMRVRRGYWRGRMVAAWKSLSADGLRVTDDIARAFTCGGANSIRLTFGRGGDGLEQSGKIGGTSVR